jgi:hypothetical protein
MHCVDFLFYEIDADVRYPADEYKLWWCDDDRTYQVTGPLIEWLEEQSIPVRYVYLLPNEEDRKFGQLSCGVSFLFDEPEYATLFKLRWQ